MARIVADRLIEGLTFDDVLLRPGRSEVLPSDVDVRTRLTRSVHLNVPIIASAMIPVPINTIIFPLNMEFFSVPFDVLISQILFWHISFALFC